MAALIATLVLNALLIGGVCASVTMSTLSTLRLDAQKSSGGIVGPAGPTGVSFPVADDVFAVVSASDASKRLVIDLTPMDTSKTLTFQATGTSSSAIPTVAFPLPIGARDVVVYENLRASLTNKSLERPILQQPLSGRLPGDGPPHLSCSLITYTASFNPLLFTANNNAGVIFLEGPGGAQNNIDIGVVFSSFFHQQPSTIIVQCLRPNWSTIVSDLRVIPGWDSVQFQITFNAINGGIGPGALPTFSYLVM